MVTLDQFLILRKNATLTASCSRGETFHVSLVEKEILEEIVGEQIQCAFREEEEDISVGLPKVVSGQLGAGNQCRKWYPNELCLQFINVRCKNQWTKCQGSVGFRLLSDDYVKEASEWTWRRSKYFGFDGRTVKSAGNHEVEIEIENRKCRLKVSAMGGLLG